MFYKIEFFVLQKCKTKIMSFPLYDSIADKIDDAIESISHDQKLTICEFIKKTDQHIHELLYMLMKVHQIKYDSTSSTTMPFNAKEQKCGIKFDVDNLPPKLQHILYNFSQMDSQTHPH